MRPFPRCLYRISWIDTWLTLVDHSPLISFAAEFAPVFTVGGSGLGEESRADGPPRGWGRCAGRCASFGTCVPVCLGMEELLGPALTPHRAEGPHRGERVFDVRRLGKRRVVVQY